MLEFCLGTSQAILAWRFPTVLRRPDLLESCDPALNLTCGSGRRRYERLGQVRRLDVVLYGLPLLLEQPDCVGQAREN